MRKRKKEKKIQVHWFKNLFLYNPKVIFLLLSFSLLGGAFVLMRMKSVEHAYALNQIEKKMKAVALENKELKAKRANLLSNRNLKALSKKFNLMEPEQSQIIVIPE